MANVPQLQAFQNQIPFGVPNQMSGMTPQNGQGLGLPNGQVSFNLPRFQMPGMDLNFAGNAGMTQSMGGGPAMPVGGINFNMTRQASSDPVQNIIGDIGNPLGGITANFAGGTPQAQQPLKQKMMPEPLTPWTPAAGEDPYGTSALAMGGVPYGVQALAGGAPFGLKGRMVGL